MCRTRRLLINYDDCGDYGDALPLVLPRNNDADADDNEYDADADTDADADADNDGDE